MRGDRKVKDLNARVYHRALILGALILCGLQAPLRAHGVDSSTERGFVAGKAYDLGRLDSVNLFSGNLTLTVPVGPSYPVGPSFSYQLNLVYNSQLWDYFNHVDCLVYVSTPTWFGLAAEDENCLTVGRPDWLANAGLGWRLTLGRILEPSDFLPNPEDPDGPLQDGEVLRYEGPDGAVHNFYSELHYQGVPCGLAVCYTRDGSYLRLQRIGELYLLEFPDGMKHTFERSDAPYVWRPVKLEDPFGNHLSISYETPHTWLLADSQGRHHQILFEADPYYGEDGRVAQVVLEAFGSAPNGQQNTTTIDLDYDEGETVPAACTSGVALSGTVDFPTGLLTGLRQTVTGGETTDEWDYEFRYFSRADEGISPGQCGHVAGRIKEMVLPTGGKLEWTYGDYATAADECLPPPDGGGPDLPPVAHMSAQMGVRQKRVLGVFGEELGVWSYKRGAVYRLDNTGQVCRGMGPRAAMSNVAYEELGNELVSRTEHFFSVYAAGNRDPAGEDWRLTDHGLPYTRHRCDPGNPQAPSDCSGFSQPVPNPVTHSGQTYYLSKTIHRCPLADVDMSPVGNPRPIHPDCDLLRLHYVRYERSLPYCSVSEGECSQLNSRVAGELVLYHNGRQDSSFEDDLREVTERQDFTGFGSYRVTRTDGTFGSAGGDAANQRTARIHLLPEGTFALHDNGDVTDTLQIPAPAERWLFSRYDFKETEESSKGVAREEACFDGKGFLLGQRTLKGLDRVKEPGDIVTKRVSGPGGFPQLEYLYGGDGRQDANSHGDLCAAAAGGAEYAVKHVHQFGALKESWQLKGSSQFLRLMDLDLDRTGLATKARDVSGIATRYTYDARGRLVKIDPPASADTVVRYNSLASAGPRVEVDRRGANGAVLAKQRYGYDGLGRLIREWRTMPGPDGVSFEALKCTQYVAAGWMKRQTDFRNAADCPAWNAAGVWTQHDFYDPFGRPERITAPDGKTIDQHYFGTEITTRSAFYRANDGVDREAKTRSIYNRQGHLIRVVEDDLSTAKRFTSYQYDVGGRLKSVEQNGTGVASQWRSFAYDGRGFLTAERQPELGNGSGGGNGELCHGLYEVNSNGNLRCVAYYDTRGNPLHRSHEPWTAGQAPKSFDLTFRYDAAGRQTQVLHQGKPIKEMFYARTNDTPGGDFREGRLVQTKRRNAVSARFGAAGATRDVVVSELYRYIDPEGRLTERQTRSSDGQIFKANFTYDQLGNLAALSYPTCLYPLGCSTASGTGRTIESLYSWGYLSRVQQPMTQGGPRLYATEISYHPNGLWNQVRHGNGTQDQQIPYRSAQGEDLPLVGQINITLTDGSLGFGPYAYDGFRNVTTIGNDQFYYDALNRLVRASYFQQGAEQRFVFDWFGNLLAFESTPLGGTPPPARSFLVDEATNRLQGEGVVYDQAGNLEWLGVVTHRVFDALGQMTHEQGQGVHRDLLYDAAGERFAILDDEGGQMRFTLRGPDNKVLRRLRSNLSGSGWAWEEDYVYRGGSLLAAALPLAGNGEEVRHFHLDHLGSTRVITQANGTQLGTRMKYWPFGENANGPAEGETMRFTGHERDFNCASTECAGLSSRDDDLDYMHARYYSPWLGRFISMDPIRMDGDSPSGWNRYAYVSGNPIANTDPTGTGLLGMASDVGAYRVAKVHSNLRPWDQERSALPLFENGLKTISTIDDAADIAEAPAFKEPGWIEKVDSAFDIAEGVTARGVGFFAVASRIVAVIEAAKWGAAARRELDPGAGVDWVPASEATKLLDQQAWDQTWIDACKSSPSCDYTEVSATDPANEGPPPN